MLIHITKIKLKKKSLSVLQEILFNDFCGLCENNYFTQRRK